MILSLRKHCTLNIEDFNSLFTGFETCNKTLDPFGFQSSDATKETILFIIPISWRKKRTKEGKQIRTSLRHHSSFQALGLRFHAF